MNMERSRITGTLGEMNNLGGSMSSNNIFKTFANLSNNIPKINVPDPGVISQFQNMTPNSVFGVTEKTHDEVIEKLSENDDIYDYNNVACTSCENLIEDYYSIFSLEPNDDYYNKEVFCSNNCLIAYIENNRSSMYAYDIYSHKRCTAFYKCEEMDNLRNKCSTSENLSVDDISRFLAVNMCESAQAGIILSTHKTYKVMEEFSFKTDKQLRVFDEVINSMSEESSKQFKINTNMTVLVIILTILNLIVAMVSVLTNGN